MNKENIKLKNKKSINEWRSLDLFWNILQILYWLKNHSIPDITIYLHSMTHLSKLFVFYFYDNSTFVPNLIKNICFSKTQTFENVFTYICRLEKIFKFAILFFISYIKFFFLHKIHDYIYKIWPEYREYQNRNTIILYIVDSILYII